MSDDPRVRLRALLAKAGGRSVVVPKDMLDSLLDDLTPVAPPVFEPGQVQVVWDGRIRGGSLPQESRAVELRRGRRVVALTTTTIDCRRLARAAWNTSPLRTGEHGKWEDLEPWMQLGQINAAREALQLLLDEPTPEL